MKLKDYTKNEKTKIENLAQFFNDNSNWQVDYIENCEDFLNSYLECIYESELYLEELETEDKILVEYLIENKNKDFILENCEGVYTNGIYRVSNELLSASFGEIEVQFSGLCDSETDCIYTELIKGMNKEEINEAKKLSGECIYNDCLYLDYSYDRASYILNPDSLIDNLISDYLDDKKAV